MALLWSKANPAHEVRLDEFIEELGLEQAYVLSHQVETIQWIESDYPAYENSKISKIRACYFDSRKVDGVILEVMLPSWAKEHK